MKLARCVDVVLTMARRTRRIFASFGAALAVLLLVAACGGGGDSESTTTDQPDEQGADVTPPESAMDSSGDGAEQPGSVPVDGDDMSLGDAGAALETTLPLAVVMTEVVNFDEIYDTSEVICGTAEEGESADCFEEIEELFYADWSGGPGIAVSSDAIWLAVDERDEVVRVGLDTLTVTDRVEVGEAPTGLAVSADAVWVASAGEETVSRIDLASREVTDAIGGLCSPQYVSVSGDGLWVGSESCDGSDDVVSRIDLGTLEVTDRFEVARLGGMTAGHDAIWVADRDGFVLRIDSETREVADPVNIGYPAQGISLSDDSVWVVSISDDVVLRIDSETLVVTDEIELRDPEAIAVGGAAVWVAEGRGYVSRIDLETRTVIDQITVGDEPAEIAVGAGAVWVIDHDDNRLRRIAGRDVSAAGDAGTDGNAALDTAVASPAAVTDIVDFNEFYETDNDCAAADDGGCSGVAELFRSPLGIGFSNDAIWLAVEDEEQVAEIWLQTLWVTDTIEVDGSTKGLAVVAGAVWVANTDDDAIVRIDLETREVTDTIEMDDEPLDLAASGDALWVAGSNGTVMRIDLETREVTDTIVVGGRRGRVAVSDDAVWLANGALWSIDLETRAMSGPVPLLRMVGPEGSEIEVDERPEAVVVSQDGVWVATPGGAVLRIDPETLVMTDVIEFEDPEALAVSDDAVWVADWEADTVSRIDLETRRVTEVIEVDEAPGAIAVGAGAVWVMSFEENTMTRIG